MKPEVFQKVTQFLQGLTFLSLFSPSFRVAPPWKSVSLFFFAHRVTVVAELNVYNFL